MRGAITRDAWDIPVDLFFYRDPEELEKNEEAQQAYEAPAAAPAITATGESFKDAPYEAPAAPVQGDWNAAAPVEGGWEAGTQAANWN